MTGTLPVKHASSDRCPECGGPFVLAGSEGRIGCGTHSQRGGAAAKKVASPPRVRAFFRATSIGGDDRSVPAFLPSCFPERTSEDLAASNFLPFCVNTQLPRHYGVIRGAPDFVADPELAESTAQVVDSFSAQWAARRELRPAYQESRRRWFLAKLGLENDDELLGFGQSLAENGVEIDVPEDIPLLGIKKGRHNLQRFFYYVMFQCHWNPDLTFEQNNLINFDWYHPAHASRHTEEEVLSWFAECGLRDARVLHTNVKGVTAIGRR